MYLLQVRVSQGFLDIWTKTWQHVRQGRGGKGTVWSNFSKGGSPYFFKYAPKNFRALSMFTTLLKKSTTCLLGCSVGWLPRASKAGDAWTLATSYWEPGFATEIWPTKQPREPWSAHVLDLLHFKKLPVRAPVVLGTQRRLPPPVVRGNKLYHKRLVSASTRAPAMPTATPTLWVGGAGAVSTETVPGPHQDSNSVSCPLPRASVEAEARGSLDSLDSRDLL